MGSKALLLFGLFVVLLIASEVSARDLSESSTEKSNEVVEKAQHPEQYGGGYYGGGHYGGGHYGGGGNGHYGGRGHYGGGGGCRYGCCHKGYHGCSKCCSYAGEAVETQPEKETGH